MTTVLRTVGVALLVVTTAGAQTRTFEAASVKLNTSSGPPRSRGVSAIPASGRFTATAITVRELIQAAYGLLRFELIDNNNPILNQRVDIVAKAPSSATVVEMQRMLQPLLAERFKLAVHRENRELEALVLVRARPDRLGPGSKRTVATVSVMVIDRIEPLVPD